MWRSAGWLGQRQSRSLESDDLAWRQVDPESSDATIQNSVGTLALCKAKGAFYSDIMEPKVTWIDS